jgi:hypothetical protein
LLKRELKVFICLHVIISVSITYTTLVQDRTIAREWTAEDEHEFTLKLEKELDKIHDFQKAKVSIVHPVAVTPRISDSEFVACSLLPIAFGAKVIRDSLVLVWC